ncbi:MAG: DMT family transporter, partial [Neisseria sp.]|nr:DMT family transporter [Neisseria sp.]
MERYSVHLKLLGMAVLWGASWPMGRMLGQSLPPLTGGAVRFVLASVLLLGWLFARSRFATLAALSARRWLGLTAAASVGVCGYAVFFMLGLQAMPAGKAAVVVAVNPVLTLLLAAWLFGERLNAKILVGMLLAVCGAITVVTQGQPLTVLSGGIKAGEWLIFGCVVCWAAYTLIGRAVLRGIDALTVTTATSFIGALMLSVVALWMDGMPFEAIAAMD